MPTPQVNGPIRSQLGENMNPEGGGELTLGLQIT